MADSGAAADEALELRPSWPTRIGLFLGTIVLGACVVYLGGAVVDLWEASFSFRLGRGTGRTARDGFEANRVWPLGIAVVPVVMLATLLWRHAIARASVDRHGITIERGPGAGSRFPWGEVAALRLAPHGPHVVGELLTTSGRVWTIWGLRGRRRDPTPLADWWAGSRFDEVCRLQGAGDPPAAWPTSMQKRRSERWDWPRWAAVAAVGLCVLAIL